MCRRTQIIIMYVHLRDFTYLRDGVVERGFVCFFFFLIFFLIRSYFRIFVKIRTSGYKLRTLFLNARKILIDYKK